MTRTWKMRPFDQDLAERLAQELALSPLIARLLVQRGVSDPGAARSFLDPSQDVLHSPFLFNEVEQAIERISRAREHSEQVVIHGDYDVDGISGTAILLETMWQLGIEADYFLPHRIEDGYGLAIDRVRELAGQFSLMITVDCGTTSIEEIALAREKGMEVIVTDHHRPGQERPAAVAILNPVLSEEEYPFAGLSGSGVAYKLAAALRESLLGMETPEEEGLDLAALGTVSDVVPLIDENRTIVSRALRRLRVEQRPGIRALLEVSSTDPKTMDASSIGFRIGPRINALGRMSNPRAAVELLITQDPSRAFEIATEMNRLNGKRQGIERRVVKEAHACVAQESLLKDDPPLLVMAGERWHRGVIGIAAARLTDRYGRPVILLSREDGVLYGSGRSLPTMNLAAVLESVRSILLSGGGHEGAIGLTLEESRYEELRKTLVERARELWGDHIEVPPLWIDAELPPEQVDDRLLEELSILGPHGEANPTPVFLFRGDASLFGGQVVGNNHLRLTLSHPRGRLQTIGYGLGDRLAQLRLDNLEIAATPVVHTYRDRRQVQLRIVDLRSAPDPPATESTPPKDSSSKNQLNRDRLGSIFRIIRSLAQNNLLSRTVLYEKSVKTGIPKEEIYLALIIFAELDLLRTRGNRIELLPGKKKRDLSQSVTFRRLTESER